MWNFPPVERLRSGPLPAALFAALLLHLLLLPLLVREPRRPGNRVSSPPAADDGPVLLRLSSALQGRLQAELAAQRRPLALSLPAPAALAALPPPPPPQRSPPQRSPLRRQAGAPAPPPAGGATSRSDRWTGSRDDRLLPAQPAAALRLALAWFPGRPAPEASGESVSQPFSEPGIELRRRQLALSAAQGQQLQRILQGAAELPSPFSDLPDGVEVRRVAASALEGFGLAQPHGVSLLRPEGLVLAWRDRAHLYLFHHPFE
ncbi:MAG: hypothetical protein R6W06_04375 [Prochlorococcaceae cyanobacterium]